MTKRSVVLDAGVPLDEPDVVIPWGASVETLLRAFSDSGLGEPKRVAAGYYVAACRIMGGLRARVGFRFEPQTDGGALREIEVFDNGEREIERSYRLFQEKLVRQFGEPSVERAGSYGQDMPSCEWRLGSISIMHYVMDRFGPEEHLRIALSASSSWRGGRVTLAIVISLGVMILYSWCASP